MRRMGEMVERVADAIIATQWAPHELPVDNDLRERYRMSARAAIAAMREPLGLTCMHGITMSERPSHTCICHTAFNVLIDAALSEK